MEISKIFLLHNLLVSIYLFNICLSAESDNNISHAKTLEAQTKTSTDLFDNLSLYDISDNGSNSKKDEQLKVTDSQSNSSHDNSHRSTKTENVQESCYDDTEKRNKSKNLYGNLDDEATSSCESLYSLIEEVNIPVNFRKKRLRTRKRRNEHLSEEDLEEYSSWVFISADEVEAASSESASKGVGRKDCFGYDSCFSSLGDYSLELGTSEKVTSKNIFERISKEAKEFIFDDVSDSSEGSSGDNEEASADKTEVFFTEFPNVFEIFGTTYSYDFFLKEHNLEDYDPNSKEKSEPFLLDNSYHRVVNVDNFTFYLFKLLYNNFKYLGKRHKRKILMRISDLSKYVDKLLKNNFIFLSNEEKERVLVSGATLLDEMFRRDIT